MGHWLAQAADRHDVLKSLLKMEPTAEIRKLEADAFKVLVSAAEGFLQTVPEAFRGNHALYKHIADSIHPCAACGRAIPVRAEEVPEGASLSLDQ